jgi:membrane dipeptidase
MPDAVTDHARRLYEAAIVWDSHSGFAPDPSVDLSRLALWRRAGVGYLSINVGFDVMPWGDTVKALAAFRRWILAHPEDYVLAGTIDQARRAKPEGHLP